MAATHVGRSASRSVDRTAVFIGLSGLHAVLLFVMPSAPVIGILLWWNANTISHAFVHRPFFQSRVATRTYALWLSVLLGVPQTAWRARHLAHHAEVSGHTNVTAGLMPVGAVWLEGVLIAGLWTVLAVWAPHVFLTAYVPGYVGGLALCWLHGHYEHAGGVTSHYGWIYNTLFFNDGYHVEHHARPHTAWIDLPRQPVAGARTSRWPPVLRWLDAANLDSLERLVVACPALQRFVMATHERAFRALLPALPVPRRVTIVGGGLFPRTALILQRVVPSAALTVIDMESANLDVARRFLDGGVRFECRRYDPREALDADLVIIPLAFCGDRSEVYRGPNAPTIIVHDWIWAPRPPTTRVSWLLLKRLNVVRS